MARQKRKLNVSTLWVTVTYRKLLRDMYPENPKVVAFRPSYRWAQRWADRHNLSKGRRSNLKNIYVEDRLPQIRRFLRRFRKLMQEPARRKGHVVSDAEAGVQAVQPRDPKYGRFQLNEGFNSDQVPVPFVNGQSETWAPKRSKRVSFAQPFSGLEKRQCTIQPTIGPGGKLMQCAVIFRGAPGSVSRRWRRRCMTLAWTFSSRKTRRPTANSAWRGLSVAFARASSRGGGGAHGGIAADVGQLARTDHGNVQGIHEEGVQLARVALPRRVHGRTAAHRCRSWDTHQDRGWPATRHMA